MRAYTTKKGDQWDIIAKAVYGDELKVDVLMKANPLLCDIYEFDDGTSVEVPDIADEEAAGMPPWRTK